MKYFIFWAILVCGFAAPADSASQLRGAAAVEKILNARVSREGLNISLSDYLNFSLHGLLGSYQNGVFRNGTPISTNFTLWKIVMTGFAAEAVKLCEGEGQQKFNAEYLESMSHLCQWPANTAKTDAALENFWLAHMGYDAPPEEFHAWKTFFLNSEFRDEPAMKAVPAMVTAILMNPHFLLRK